DENLPLSSQGVSEISTLNEMLSATSEFPGASITGQGNTQPGVMGRYTVTGVNPVDSNVAPLREIPVPQATQATMVSPTTDTGSSATVQELVDGLLNADAGADADAGGTRAERSQLANAGTARGTQSGQS